MSKPLFYVPLTTSEEVVNNSNFMTHQHQGINQVWPDKTSTSSNLSVTFNSHGYTLHTRSSSAAHKPLVA